MHAVIVKLKKSNCDPKLSVRTAGLEGGIRQLPAMESDADEDSGEDIVQNPWLDERSTSAFCTGTI
ncbi:MAG: hypothetical protein DMG89_15150 [Acidobacteria bacterium]|nr:MAG: hypothetical protein DMG89_15150 [Acidobacteriota bacterium]